MDPQILWYAGRATGAVSLVLFTAVLVVGILTAGRAGVAGLPRAGVQRLHRSLSLVAIVFLTVHIVTTIVDGYVDIGWWDVVVPFAAGYDPFWVGLGTVAVDLLVAIGITSALRRRLPLGVWRAVHLTAYAMWPIALLHGLGRIRRRRSADVVDRRRHRLRGNRAGRPGIPAAARPAPGHRGPAGRAVGPSPESDGGRAMTTASTRRGGRADTNALTRVPDPSGPDRLLPGRPGASWVDHVDRLGPPVHRRAPDLMRMLDGAGPPRPGRRRVPDRPQDRRRGRGRRGVPAAGRRGGELL